MKNCCRTCENSSKELFNRGKFGFDHDLCFWRHGKFFDVRGNFWSFQKHLHYIFASGNSFYSFFTQKLLLQVILNCCLFKPSL
jgi:hypothetical protein